MDSVTGDKGHINHGSLQHNGCRINLDARFGALTALKIQVVVLWVVTLFCRRHARFGSIISELQCRALFT
jgi:hypothetical protein